MGYWVNIAIKFIDLLNKPHFNTGNTKWKCNMPNCDEFASINCIRAAGIVQLFCGNHICAANISEYWHNLWIDWFNIHSTWIFIKCMKFLCACNLHTGDIDTDGKHIWRVCTSYAHLSQCVRFHCLPPYSISEERERPTEKSRKQI